MKKLKSIMHEHFLRELSSPSFLPKDVNSSTKNNFSPCTVAGSSSWDESEGNSNKSFSFINRQSMHSFCGYIFDLEQYKGTQVSLVYKATENDVDLSIPHHLFGKAHLNSFFQEIDNIYYDVIESFKNEQ